jgi:hypothetical protein
MDLFSYSTAFKRANFTRETLSFFSKQDIRIFQVLIRLLRAHVKCFFSSTTPPDLQNIFHIQTRGKTSRLGQLT